MKGLRAVTVKIKLDVDYLNLFYVQKTSKKKFKCSQEYYIVRTLLTELELLRAWL